MNNTLVEQIDALLPQTQCTKCGYAGCMPYAQAISQGQAAINQCPPGGEQGIKKLAALLGVVAQPLDRDFGVERPRLVAVIDESACIGCAKCSPPCPVDAILGAAKQMHSIITELCTGCELCVAPCPVNCISMEVSASQVWEQSDADLARNNFHRKKQRLAEVEAEKVRRQQQQIQKLALLKQPKSNITE